MSILKKDAKDIVAENMSDPRSSIPNNLGVNNSTMTHDPRVDASATKVNNVDSEDLVHDKDRLDSDDVPASDKGVAMHQKSVTRDIADKDA